MGDGQTAQPGAEEAADLVREHGDAEQGAKVAGAEQLADDGGGGWHGGEPGEAEAGGEKVESPVGAWQQQVHRDQQHA